MTPEGAVMDRLSSLSALTSLVSTRIYTLKLPQKPTLPAVRVQKIASVRDQHLRGPGHIYKTRVQVDAYAAESSGTDPYQAVSEVAAAIRGDGLGTGASGLWGWSGTTGSPSLVIYNAELLADDDPFYEAAELRAVRIRQDYLIHWSES